VRGQMDFILAELSRELPGTSQGLRVRFAAGNGNRAAAERVRSPLEFVPSDRRRPRWPSRPRSPGAAVP